MSGSKHVAVLMGGWSSEREVSLRSGKACLDALERKGYRVTRIDVKRDIATVLDTLRPDVAMVMLHGKPGEDGDPQPAGSGPGAVVSGRELHRGGARRGRAHGGSCR